MKRSIPRDEQGSVLLITLMILVVLTLIGIQALDTTDIELAVTTNEKAYKETLNAADGANFVAIKTVSQALNISASPTLTSPLAYTNDDNDPDTTDAATANPEASFYQELIGIDSHDENFDLSFPVSPTTSALVDVELIRVRNLAGGGAEFASSYSGVGASGPKGAEYDVTALSIGPNNTQSRIRVRYAKALGVAGGL